MHKRLDIKHVCVQCGRARSHDVSLSVHRQLVFFVSRNFLFPSSGSAVSRRNFSPRLAPDVRSDPLDFSLTTIHKALTVASLACEERQNLAGTERESQVVRRFVDPPLPSSHLYTHKRKHTTLDI